MELKAEKDKIAKGTVIESKINKKTGVVATVIIQEGTLKKQDVVICGDSYSRVRVLLDDKGQQIKEATPSTPVEIIGLSKVPAAGDGFMVVASEKEAQKIIDTMDFLKKKREIAKSAGGLETKKKLNLIIKCDVDGSAEAIQGLIMNIKHPEITITIIQKGAGVVSNSDILLAHATKSSILAFNVGISDDAKLEMKEKNILVYSYKIIYELEKDVKEMISNILDPKIQENIIGTGEIKKVFSVSKIGIIAGSQVKSGSIKKNAYIKIIRNGESLGRFKIVSLKSFQEDVREVKSGHECGIQLNAFEDFKEGDKIECVELESVKQTID